MLFKSIRWRLNNVLHHEPFDFLLAFKVCVSHTVLGELSLCQGPKSFNWIKMTRIGGVKHKNLFQGFSLLSNYVRVVKR